MTLTHRRAVRHLIIGMATATALTACGTERDDGNAAGDTPAVTGQADTAGQMAGHMPGMGSMDSGMMAGGMMGGAAMAEMEAHMRMMAGTSADSMQAMLPMHRQMVANMLSRMNGEMRQMNMAGDAAWTATADSLRQDLVRMPELSGQELRDLMPAHHTRMTRLMQMHERMMADMRR